MLSFHPMFLQDEGDLFSDDAAFINFEEEMGRRVNKTKARNSSQPLSTPQPS